MITLDAKPTSLLTITPGEGLVLPKAAWYAGLFDGEGCICTRPIGSGSAIGVMLSLGNTFGYAVKLFEMRYGGKCQVIPAGKRGRKRKFYSWRLSVNSRVVLALENMLPHLIIKREQAMLVLEYSRFHWRGSGKIRTDEQKAKDIHYAEMISALKFETPQYSWE